MQTGQSYVATVFAAGLVCICAVQAHARDCKTFPDVTPAIAECARQTSELDYDLVFKPAGDDKGTVITETLIGKVVLDYDYDTGAETMHYCIVGKPWIVTTNQVFDGIEETFEGCRAQ